MNQKFVAEAPVVIAACAAVDTDYVMMCGQLAYPIDTAIAADHMTLQAVEEGLGTCWIGAFHEERVKQLLGIPGEGGFTSHSGVSIRCFATLIAKEPG